MNPIELLHKYYDPNSKAYSILYSHSKAVMEKALELARFPSRNGVGYVIY